MTQEEKNLLLKDLCARLPYEVKVQMADGAVEELLNVNVSTFICNGLRGLPKPYLFPQSSMTEEIIDEIYNNAGVYDIDSSVHIEVGTKFEDLTKMFDILHKHHIDYQNLIEKGLAIDATGLNIY